MALIKEQDEPGCEGLIQTIESYYKHGDKDAAGRKLLEALQRGCIVGIDLLQKLVDYVYKESSDEAKIVKLTSLELLRIDDSFRNLIRKTYRDNIKDLQCSVHGHRPYILSSKEPSIFIACCCDVLVREMHGAFSKDLEPTAKLVDEGWKLQQRGKFEQAIRKYEEVLKIESKNKEIPMLACINMGNIFFDRKEFEVAIQNYKKAVEINPSHDWPHYNLANAYGEIGKFEEAISEYNKAIKINPQDAGCHRNLGLVYREIGENSLAAQEIQKCVEISHGADPLDYYNLGCLHYKMQNDRDAKNWFERYINEAPIRQHKYKTNAKRMIEKIRNVEI